MRDVNLFMVSLSQFVDSDEVKEKLLHYIDSILLWNNAYNLTAVTNRDEAIVKHLYDSLVLVDPLKLRLRKEARLVDVGSGAGLPGIPLSLVMPKQHFTLLDSGIKRVRFMRQMVIELGLKNVEVVHSRVQEYMPSELYDVVLSRAFASGEDMVKWSSHLIDKEQGFFAAMKGVFLESEWQNLSGYMREVIALDVPELNEERHLVLLSKE